MEPFRYLKTGEDRNLSFAKKLWEFAKEQKYNPANDFDPERDKLIVVFDGDIFEEKVQGYDELITSIEESDLAAVTNPNFELFLVLHKVGSYERYIKGHEDDFLLRDEKNRYSHAYNILLELTGVNAKTNSKIGELAEDVLIAIEQEKKINQDIHRLRGNVTSNIGKIVESIIEENPGL